MPNGGNVYVNQYLGTNFVQDPGVSSFIARDLQEPKDMVAASASKCLGSGIYGSDPVIVYNRDIMSMFLQVQDHMARIERNNEVLRRDMENLRRRVDIPAPQATTTPLKSRILDFDTPYAAGYNEDFVAMQGSIRIPDSIYSPGILTIQDPEHTPRSSFMSANHGTVSTDYLSGTNVLQDPGLTPNMAREVHELKDMISNVLDVVQPIPGAAPTSYGISGFTPPICDTKIPKGFVRLEEDAMIQKRMETSSTYDKPNRKINSSSFRLNRSKPYSRNGDCRIIADKEDNERRPKLTYCCFYTDASDILCAMQKLGDIVRWPKKDVRNTGWKDKSKWCAFHNDFGHIAEDCNTLRKEVNYLLSKGHLKELFGKEKDQSKDLEKARDPEFQDNSRIPRRAGSPPSGVKDPDQ